MLTNHQKLAIFWLLTFSIALWIQWWASSGFPLEGEICEIADHPKNCGSYNIFFYSAYRLAAISNQWSALVTAAATGIIGYFTYTLWQTNKEQIRHNRITERAYIVGGGPANGGLVSIGNYGKTPAILKKVEWGFCNEKFFPSGVSVNSLLNDGLIPQDTIKFLEKEDVLRPGQGPHGLPGTDINVSGHEGEVFFGRFTYTILFDDAQHFSTFKLKIKEGHTIGLPGSYSDWN